MLRGRCAHRNGLGTLWQVLLGGAGGSEGDPFPSRSGSQSLRARRTNGLVALPSHGTARGWMDRHYSELRREEADGVSGVLGKAAASRRSMCVMVLSMRGGVLSALASCAAISPASMLSDAADDPHCSTRTVVTVFDAGEEVNPLSCGRTVLPHDVHPWAPLPFVGNGNHQLCVLVQ